jgi:ribonucleoside-triphosphate reductase
MGYEHFIKECLQVIYDLNRKAEKTYGCKFNTEFVPGESLGVKFAKWDKDYGMPVQRECYNSYFYPVEEDIMLPIKARLHGRDTGEFLDGGSALHLNLPHLPTEAGACHIMRLMAKAGVPYYGINVRMTGCNACGKNHEDTTETCIHCGSTDLKYATRVIGYCRWEGDFSKERKKEAAQRSYTAHEHRKD